ncbi:unnamed protein product [Ostreobium quekettii]|uniref:S1 motif domain-containing protein n=1 Tax=Ostreobium quekettii TaxID=121088 RepID=A0A8S1J3D9_9CHLO|nr:unnamed protein product [Ostreobium quekettii]|eukprot:evm.model.scf_25EXC.7 EVM.evm.TU.scf_25EXC.7   scf_25EXC:131295-135944(+)
MSERGPVVCPGDRLGQESNYIAGAGTYGREGFIYASIVGRQEVTSAQGDAEKKLPIVTVTSMKGGGKVVPQIGDVVTGRVTRLRQQAAVVDILCVGERALHTKFQGQIRTQDVRAKEIDKVTIPTSFRPGDLVRAEVLSFGDANFYYLSTAKNELGVVYAESPAGVPMVPISWQDMQCPQTHVRERRKVAKVVQNTQEASK